MQTQMQMQMQMRASRSSRLGQGTRSPFIFALGRDGPPETSSSFVSRCRPCFHRPLPRIPSPNQTSRTGLHEPPFQLLVLAGLPHAAPLPCCAISPPCSGIEIQESIGRNRAPDTLQHAATRCTTQSRRKLLHFKHRRSEGVSYCH